MFGFHPDKQLTAYCQGELSAEETRRLEAHLQRCRRCRQQVELRMRAQGMLSQLPTLTAPETLWNRIEGALPETARAAPQPAQTSASRFRRPLLAYATAAAALVIGAISWRMTPLPHPPHPQGPTLAVTNLAGAPRVGADRIGKTGQLGVGQYLETDASSRAEITVAKIGAVQVEPNTRIGLKVTGPNEQRLDLTHGEMQAKVLAPPRLFLVDTPGATAVDLGCAYTLKVDEQGNTWLHVTSGHVALMVNHREVTVPRDAICETRTGIGTGTPYFADATPAFQEALLRFDFEGGGDADLNTVLQGARLQDTLTLWNLLFRANEPQRGRLIDCMMRLIPPPEGVTRAAALRLDPKTLELWRADLEVFW